MTRYWLFEDPPQKCLWFQILWVILGSCGPFGAHLGSPLASFGCLRVPFGFLWADLGPSSLLAILWNTFASLWCVLGRLWDPFGLPWASVERQDDVSFTSSFHKLSQRKQN